MVDGTFRSVKFLIIGAGLSGLAAAYHLKENFLLFESNNNVGGTADSDDYNVFKLDNAGHVLYFQNEWTKKFIEDEIKVPLIKNQRSAWVWIDGVLIPFPIQFNLFALPFFKRIKIAISALTSSANFHFNKHSRMLYDRSLYHYGKELTNLFFKPYNEKLWGVDCRELTIDWMDNFVPKPNFMNIVSGLFSAQTDHGLNQIFYYPAEGAINTISKRIGKRINNISLNHQLVNLNPNEKIAEFSSGSRIKYEYLISTIPLVELINCFSTDQQKYFSAVKKLRSNSLILAHVLIPATNVGNGIHWIYYPSVSIPFYRITFQHAICKQNCPEGWSALTLEFGGSLFDKKEMEQSIINYLIQMKLISHHLEGIKILWKFLPYGYVIYDNDILNSRSEILNLLKSFNIYSIGRYGAWEYSNMESALLHGKNIALKLNSEI